MVFALPSVEVALPLAVEVFAPLPEAFAFASLAELVVVVAGNKRVAFEVLVLLVVVLALFATLFQIHLFYEKVVVVLVVSDF